MKKSYCGLCEDCQLGAPAFLGAVTTLKNYLEGFREQWWAHCFPGEEGFSLPEFKKGLDWFLDHPECPGCRGGKGVDRCPIRLCALMRHQESCAACPDLAACEKFNFLLKEFPDQKAKLLRQRWDKA